MTATIRAIVLFGFLSMCSAPGSALPRVEFKSSEMLSLWHFATAVQSDSHNAPELRELFEQRADEAARRAAIEFDRAVDAGPSRLEYPDRRQRPPGRRYGVSVSGMLEAHAGESESLEDFGLRIDGLLPPQEHASLMKALTQLEDLHREAVWEPSRAMTRRAIRRLKAAAEETEFAERLQAAAAFYETEWPDEVPFRVFVAPMPIETRYGRAHANGTTAVILAAPTLDPDRMLGVVFHEFCHALWKHQDPFRQRLIVRTLDAHPARSAARHVGGLLNEALATALGNGWFRRHQYGDEVMEAQWYADETVSTFAKTLYPLVDSYLTDGAAIDETFLNYAVARFAWKFGGALDVPATIMRDVLVFTDGDVGAAQVLSELGEHFQSPQSLAAEPVGHPRLRMRYRQKRWTTVIVVGAPRPELDQYEPGLAARCAELWDGGIPFVHFAHGADGRIVILMGARTDGEVSALISRIAELERFEPSVTLRP